MSCLGIEKIPFAVLAEGEGGVAGLSPRLSDSVLGGRDIVVSKSSRAGDSEPRVRESRSGDLEETTRLPLFLQGHFGVGVSYLSY